ncbi:MAG: hypothetical protein HBSAPP03_21670 [Phycisphaerae bacterium]|nr:MAG: hypothetical protein HBSAPP03_21670 [Phycisphaerae bacterium]
MSGVVGVQGALAGWAEAPAAMDRARRDVTKPMRVFMGLLRAVRVMFPRRDTPRRVVCALASCEMHDPAKTRRDHARRVVGEPCRRIRPRKENAQERT